MATLSGGEGALHRRRDRLAHAGQGGGHQVVRLGDIETQPLYHPISQLVYATGRDKVTDVWVAGYHLVV